MRSSPSEKGFAMSNTEIDHESRCRAPFPRREDLEATDQKIFDDVNSSSSQLLRGLHGPAGLWLHDPKLAELYLPFQSYLRFGAGLTETVREACILATARECDSSFEWAAHEAEAQRVGVPDEVIAAIKYRKNTSTMQAPYGTVVQLVREALTEHAVDADTYQAAVSLLGMPRLVDLITLAGTYASTAALLCVFDMQLDDDETNLLPSLH
jgi:4-carboxymuconolactone decarboxylase